MIVQRPYPPATRGKVVVWGFLGSSAFGGIAWQAFHYLIPLRRLGFDVWYVEDAERVLYDPVTYDPALDCDANVRLLERFMADAGFAGRWAFRDPITNTMRGALDFNGLEALYRESVFALNVCGCQEIEERQRLAPVPVYVDTDPVSTQVRVASGEAWLIEQLDAHRHHFTYATNLGAPDCRIPLGRYTWRPTVPPVCTDLWDTGEPPAPDAAFTTVLNWKHSGKDIEWAGEKWHWSKDREFRRFADVPKHVAARFELCCGGATAADLAPMKTAGWRTLNSADYADPFVYRRYIQGSLAEFSAAKEQYVAPRSGWFSDRTVCYLAAGRPAVVQDTGFGSALPVGEGLLAFADLDGAIAAARAVAADYAKHAKAAREIAREYFEGERVIAAMLSAVGVGC